MFSSVIEERLRKNDSYTVRLTVPRNEIAFVYGGDIQNATAYEFMKNYLYHVEDNGRLNHVEVKNHTNSNLVVVEGEVSYGTGEHTDYQPHYQFTNMESMT